MAEQVWCTGCGAALPGIFANHPWCAWCVKEQSAAQRWTTYRQGHYRQRHTRRGYGRERGGDAGAG